MSSWSTSDWRRASCIANCILWIWGGGLMGMPHLVRFACALVCHLVVCAKMGWIED